MNTKTIACLIFAASFSITSCKKELQPQESSTDTTAVANTAAPAATPVQATPLQPNQAVQANPAQVQTTATQVVSQPAKTAKGMNPPHGQPGHRCDIAVGAPLNSAPAKPAITQTTPQATTVQKGLPSANTPVGVAAPASATPAVTAPGMNPPHGQPGHDCAVAVGAPLPKKQ